MSVQISTLSLPLDTERLRLMEREAAAQGLSLEAFVLKALDKALQSENKPRSQATRVLQGAERAPLDAFLPEGTNPFAAEGGERLSFADLQAHLRFAGCNGVSR